MKNTFLFSITIILFSSCATTPVVQVPQPWTRTFGNPQSIEESTTLFINVNGEEKHLLLDNALLDGSIYKGIESQLLRRDFEITKNEQNADYILNISYFSKDVQVMRTEVQTYQSSSQYNYSGTSTGILAALAVGAQASRTSTSNKAESSTHTAYRHTVGFSINNLDNELIWTGESTWESGSPDITSRISTVSQILLSNLPGYGEVTPRVPAVNPEKEENYYKLYVEDRNFVGPALPYTINFERSAEDSRSLSQNLTIRGVSDPRISRAVIDLIQTAEFAVPRDPNYENPISTTQWNRVNLGGSYYIGDDNQPTNILIELRGSRDGYTIRNASKASQSEYSAFLSDLEKWQNALIEYYNVFE